MRKWITWQTGGKWVQGGEGVKGLLVKGRNGDVMNGKTRNGGKVNGADGEIE